MEDVCCAGSGTKQQQPAVRREGEMNKRKLGSFALWAMLLALSMPAEAQQPKKIPRIGFVSGRSTPTSATPDSSAEAFRHGMRDLGYIEGKNISVEYRYAEGKPDRFPGLVAELVRVKIDVIVSPSLPAVRAAEQATGTVPIVMLVTSDPVAAGLVDSLARPGRNITGLYRLTRDLSGKRLELLREAIPGIGRIGVISDGQGEGSAIALKEYETAARALELQFQSLEISGREPGLERLFRAAAKARVGALITVRTLVLVSYEKNIAELAIKNRMPSMFEEREAVEVGGLISYSSNEAENFKRVAVHVDKILKGTKPADIPVEQPTKFEFVINLKTAKQIGVTIPPNVLARADRVIR
jgi:putative ABC transport system substrate-binding protein